MICDICGQEGARIRRVAIEISGKTFGFGRDCFASLAMTQVAYPTCHCERSEAISKPQLFIEDSIEYMARVKIYW